MCNPLDYFSLFRDDVLWNWLLTETHGQAERVIAAKPINYAAKSFQQKPLTLAELKAFWGLWVTMEMLIHKDRNKQYWWAKDATLAYTPGFPKVMARDRFLAIRSLLHCVNQDDPQLDKTDKIHKTGPVFSYLIEKYKHFFVTDCEPSLDEGMIPTKNKLSFKHYIKGKPIPRGIKTFLFCDSENWFIEKLCQELGGDVQSTGAAFGNRCSAEFQDERRFKRDAHHDVEKAPHATTNNYCFVCREKYLRDHQRNPQAKDEDLLKQLVWLEPQSIVLAINSKRKKARQSLIKKYHLFVITRLQKHFYRQKTKIKQISTFQLFFSKEPRVEELKVQGGQGWKG